jgi:predicted Co/Zn/Cd cation transporter (cation efflux family)
MNHLINSLNNLVIAGKEELSSWITNFSLICCLCLLFFIIFQDKLIKTDGIEIIDQKTKFFLWCTFISFYLLAVCFFVQSKLQI